VKQVESHHVLVNRLNTAPHSAAFYELGVLQEYDFEVVLNIPPILLFPYYLGHVAHSKIEVVLHLQLYFFRFPQKEIQ
jgi:hypothetical protein